MKIYLDIETIPTQRQDVKDHLKKGLTPPANYKDPEKIGAYIAKAQREVVHDTGLSGLFGEVWCIGFTADEGPVDVLTRGRLEDSEAELLEDFQAVILKLSGPRPTWVGHAITWDLRFLWHRFIVNGIKPQLDFALDAKPWDDIILDTMTMWSGIRDRVSLDNLCLALGIPMKDGLDGSKVWSYIQADPCRWEEVREYCRDDVLRCRAVYRRLTFQTSDKPTPF